MNESNPQEDKESTPQEDKESKPEKQSINIICKQDNQPREDYTDQRELELEEENVEYSQNERPNFNLVTYERLVHAYDKMVSSSFFFLNNWYHVQSLSSIFKNKLAGLDMFSACYYTGLFGVMKPLIP